jgi:hypothetical protein
MNKFQQLACQHATLSILEKLLLLPDYNITKPDINQQRKQTKIIGNPERI